MEVEVEVEVEVVVEDVEDVFRFLLGSFARASSSMVPAAAVLLSSIGREIWPSSSTHTHTHTLTHTHTTRTRQRCFSRSLRARLLPTLPRVHAAQKMSGEIIRAVLVLVVLLQQVLLLLTSCARTHQTPPSRRVFTRSNNRSKGKREGREREKQGRE